MQTKGSIYHLVKRTTNAFSKSCLINIISGEWLLNYQANGGGVILFRSLWCSSILFIFTLLIMNFIDPTKTYDFSTYVLKEQVLEKISWFGVFFATIYAAFYARFSSQWTYLANLYNSIKQISATSESNDEILAELKAAFIEDAEYLHLARKKNFASIIYHWGKDPVVRDKYIKFTPGGEYRFNKIMEEVNDVYHIIQEEYMKH